MELKQYQREVIADLGLFIERLEKDGRLDVAFNNFWGDKGVSLASLDHAYLRPYDNSVTSVPPRDGKGSDRRRKDLHSLQCAADDFREAADGETESRGMVRPLRHDSETDLQEPERPVASLPAKDRQPFRERSTRGR